MNKIYKYQQVANELIKDYCSLLQLGDLLPLTVILCEKYEVSEITIKKAMAILVDLGLVKRIPRKGTMLIRHPGKEEIFPGKKTTLYVLADKNWNFTAVMERIMKKFCEMRKDIHFQFIYISNDAIELEFLAKTCDLVLVNSGSMRIFLSNPRYQNDFMSLSELQGFLFDEDLYFPEIIPWCKDSHDDVKCLPVNFSTVCNCVNLDYVPEITAEHFQNLNFDQYIDLLENLPKSNRIHNNQPFIFSLTWHRWPILLNSLAHGIFDSTGKKCLLDTPDSMGVIQKIIDLMYQRQVMMPIVHARDTVPNDKHGLFSRGHFLCSWEGTASVHQPMNFQKVLTPLPLADNPSTYLMIEGIMVNRQLSKQKEICDFLNFLQVGENQLKLSKDSDGISARRQIAHIDLKMNKSNMPGSENFILSLQYAQMVNIPSYEIFDLISTSLYPVWLGLEPVEETCKILTQKVNHILHLE